MFIKELVVWCVMNKNKVKKDILILYLGIIAKIMHDFLRINCSTFC